MNVLCRAPAAIVTVAGTLPKFVLFVFNTTTIPPAVAAELRVMVPVEDVPPFTLAGLSANEEFAAGTGVSVRDAVWLIPPKVPVIVLVAATVTEVVEMAKVAVVLPAAPVAEFGTVADASVIETATTAPPEGAAALRVIVPAETFPPSTLVGLIITEARTAAGRILRSLPY